MKLYQITSNDGLLELEVGVCGNQDLEGEVKCIDLNEQEWITVNGWALNGKRENYNAKRIYHGKRKGSFYRLC